MAAVAERVERVVGPLVSAAGLDLEGVEVQQAGRRRVVRVLVDTDGGVSLDAVADLSKALSEALDADDAMGDQPYVLEVTSPGVDRPLTQPRHWRRNAGRLVSAGLADGRRLTGRIDDSDDIEVTLLVDGVPVRVEYAGITRAQVEVEFNRPTEG